MTVAELINILQTFPQDMPVRMSMNSEYECGVEPDMVYEDEGAFFGRHVRIDSEGEDSWSAGSYEVNPDQKRADERYGLPN